MTTLSVPIPPRMEEAIENLIRQGIASNKADAVRRALNSYIEEQVIKEVLEAQREVAAGKVFYGDLHKLAKKFK